MIIQAETTLILSGTGKTGRRVAQRLAARGVPLRLGSRTATPAFDWLDSRTWPALLEGVRAIYLAYHPDLAAPGAAEHIQRFMGLAVRSGARRIVLLSGRGEPGVLPSERAVRESGAAFTILRAAWFCQNFSEGHLLDPVRSGTLAFPGGSVAEPFVDVEDLADVAARALTDDVHAGRTYELTGPRLVTFAEAAEEIARAAGRDVHYVPISTAEYAAALAEHLPAEQAGFLSQLFADLLDGHNAHLSGDVRRVLGRSPRDFSEYARDAAASGVWAP
jgi:uncharacterized protein YbjT (DUF2867 family)